MNWNTDVSQSTRHWLQWMGDFSPTVNPLNMELKGYLYDDEGGGKAYLNTHDLHKIAAACTEAANWLCMRKVDYALRMNQEEDNESID